MIDKIIFPTYPQIHEWAERFFAFRHVHARPLDEILPPMIAEIGKKEENTARFELSALARSYCEAILKNVATEKQFGLKDISITGFWFDLSVVPKTHEQFKFAVAEVTADIISMMSIALPESKVEGVSKTEKPTITNIVVHCTREDDSSLVLRMSHTLRYPKEIRP